MCFLCGTSICLSEWLLATAGPQFSSAAVLEVLVKVFSSCLIPWNFPLYHAQYDMVIILHVIPKHHTTDFTVSLSSFLIILHPALLFDVGESHSCQFTLWMVIGFASPSRYHLPNLVDLSRLPVCCLPPEVRTLCCSPDTHRLLAINTAFNTRYSVEATA